jgi:hypothetical protein
LLEGCTDEASGSHPLPKNRKMNAFVSVSRIITPLSRYKTNQVFKKTAEGNREIKVQRICSIMKLFITRGRLVKAAMALILMAAIFLAGARRGYDLGFTDGETRTNSWWIDKKSNYYEATKIKQKRISLKYNEI